MPEMDGYEVARRIQNNPILQNLTILFITAHGEVFSISTLMWESGQLSESQLSQIY